MKKKIWITKPLLSLSSHLVEDKRRSFVVKGVGWELKTIGKYKPDLVKEFFQLIKS